jgi:hypothetical protein
MTVQTITHQVIFGSSTDTKPTAGISTNTLYFELDSGDVYKFIGGVWSLFSSRTKTETLTNKTITSPVISTIKTGSGATLTLPTTTDTLLGRNTTDTLANKTLTLPTIATINNGGVITLPTGTRTLVARDTADTLLSKTINVNSNTLTATSQALGDILLNNGSQFLRLGRGATGQVLTSTASTVQWANAPTGTGIPRTAYDYHIYIATDGTYKALNNKTTAIDYSQAGTDIGALLNTIMTAKATTGVTIFLDEGSYTTLTPVTLPTYLPSAIKQIAIHGIMPGTRLNGSMIFIGSTFPNQRYILESTSAASSTKFTRLWLNGLGFANNSYAKSGTAGQNLNGGTPVIDAGILLYDTDHTDGVPLILEDLYSQYFWRGYHLKGYQYFGRMINVVNIESNSNVVEDAWIIMEKGSHVDYPKGYDIQHLVFVSSAGLSGGTGSVNNAIVFGGGYHNARDITTDGTKYNESVIAFKQCFSSKFNGLFSEDLNVAQGGSFKAVYLFDSNDFSGNAPVHTPGEYATLNNQVYDIAGGRGGNYTIAFYNGAYKNVVRAYGYWGSTTTINDAGAGIGNIVEIIEGQQPVSVSTAKVTTTNSLVKVRDTRVGASDSGLSTQSGNGSTKVFNIAHGLFATPLNYRVEPLSADAAVGRDITVTSTNIVITYSLPPLSGTNNLKWSWMANAY